jgi:predicted house-cleaning noncanonical NTP pyrophosphatase (MazG superfamily)
MWNQGRKCQDRRNPKAIIGMLKPNRPVWKIGPHGVVAIEPESIVADCMGWKACGLASLPSEWVPTFFVFDTAALAFANGKLQRWIKDALAKASISVGSVIIRSSGAEETLRSRGSLASETCPIDQIPDTLRRLSSRVSNQSAKNIHWIVQTYIPPKMRGHLSNERHLSRENRDWVVEIELQKNRPGYISRIAIRKWRDGTTPPDLDLRCGSELQITLCLKKVAHWATISNERIHFEWVWDGSVIWLVQADRAGEEDGVNPTSLRPDNIAEILATDLSAFKVANAQHFETYSKLKNAKLYSEIGYCMPQFYILEDQKILKNILQGRIPSVLDSDLSFLTKRSFIIRTDGNGIPFDRRQMLPRSEELRSVAAAKAWLITAFKARIEESGLLSASLCLIGHHFLPSLASACAEAEPGKRMVRIESIWGLPEGLYWYSHDTFEVDVQTGVYERSIIEKCRIFKRLRYKGTFIAPDSAGHWIPMHTRAPYDWRPSIKHKKWRIEIASTTRKIADCEGHPVVVMWFVDNDMRVTRHKWQLERQPKAAPHKRLAISRDYVISNHRNWQKLKELVLGGTRIERIIVKPIDPELIRNPKFAEELGAFANKHKIVVELAGGILSHAFYVLQRSGAQVECTDLVGAEEDVVEYNKVVRDKVPAIIEGRSEKAEVIQLSGDALVAALRQKLVEEAFEALDVKAGNELITELADVMEVISAIAQAIHSSSSQVALECKRKRRLRGGFDRGFMLRKTAAPHSLSSQATPSEEQGGSSQPYFEMETRIVDPAEVPTSTPYRRPDLRSVNQQTEKLFAFETELNKLGNAKLSTTFELPLNTGDTRSFTLSIEIARIGATMRGNVRLRLLPKQMDLDISELQPRHDSKNGK